MREDRRVDRQTGSTNSGDIRLYLIESGEEDGNTVIAGRCCDKHKNNRREGGLRDTYERVGDDE